MKNFLIGLIVGVAITAVFFMLAYNWSPWSPLLKIPVSAPNDEQEIVEERAVLIFVPNSQLDEEAEGEVYPLERTVRGTDEELIENTIKLLISGELTRTEEGEGYHSVFPHDKFRLLALELTGGVLELEFSEEPGFTTGGSLQMLTLRRQIEETALQFEAVEEVVIKPETLFQP